MKMHDIRENTANQTNNILNLSRISNLLHFIYAGLCVAYESLLAKTVQKLWNTVSSVALWKG